MRGGYIYNDLPPVVRITQDLTLIEELFNQLRLSIVRMESNCSEFIIGNLDERGYLDCTYQEVLDHTRVEQDDLEGAVLMLKEFTPFDVRT